MSERANPDDHRLGGATSDGAAERYRVTIDPTATNDSHSFALQMIGAGRRVLELGCASGDVTEHLVAAGNEVVGVESDATAAAAARRFADRVHRLDLDRDRVSEVESATFDVILAGDVLEHLRDPTTALADALTLLDDGGEVVLSIPNAAHADVRLHLLEGRVQYADEGLLDRTHLRWFTRASIRQLLDDVGLVALELRRVVRPLGEAEIGVDMDLHSRFVIDFVRADPDHDTFQFVVRARRRPEPPGTDAVDALAPVDHEWPVHSCDEIDELRSYAGDLRRALDTWEGSRYARLQRRRAALTERLRSTIGR